MNWSELSLFVSACAASLGGLVAATRHSRCTNIRTPCISCDRELEAPSIDDDEEENTLHVMEQGRAKPISFKDVEKHVASTTPPAPKSVTQLRKMYDGSVKS